MSSRGGVTVNDEFFDSLGRDPGVVGLCKRAADAVAARARASAPRATGAYADSIHVEERSAAYRDMFRVVADSDNAMGVEARTGNLARAANVRIY